MTPDFSFGELRQALRLVTRENQAEVVDLLLNRRGFVIDDRKLCTSSCLLKLRNTLGLSNVLTDGI